MSKGKTNQQQWLIIETAKGKKKLAQMHSSSNDLNTNVVDMETGEIITISTTNIVAKLPKKPRYGRVYGVLVEPKLKTVSHPYFGEVELYRNDKVELAKLKSAMDTVAKRLKSVKVNLTSTMELVCQFRHASGKMIGKFAIKRSSGDEKPPAVLTVCVPENAAQAVYDYVVAHESGHGVWYTNLSQPQRDQWVQLFVKQAKLSQLDPKKIAKLKQRFLHRLNKGSIECLGDFEQEVTMLEDEDATDIWNLAVDNVLRAYRLKEQHLNAVFKSSAYEMFSKCWPELARESEFEIPVTEYSTTNPEELFAEAFTYWLFGNKLKPEVEKLMRSHMRVEKPKAVKLEPLPEGLKA